MSFLARFAHIASQLAPPFLPLPASQQQFSPVVVLVARLDERLEQGLVVVVLPHEHHVHSDVALLERLASLDDGLEGEW